MTTKTILTHGECLAEMAEIPDQYVDMVMCDLPYGTTQNKWDTPIDLTRLWPEYRRICKGAIVLTAAQPFTSVLVCSNLKDFKYQWVWEKTNKATGHLNAKKQPLRSTEDVCIWYSEQGVYNPQMSTGVPYYTTPSQAQSTNYGVSRPTEKVINTGIRYPTNIIKIPADNVGRHVKSYHPTQKPVALMEYLIKTYTHEGMTVLDNCMGSGTTGVACVNTGRHFVGIEQDEAYFEIACKRIEEAKVNP